jgi:hypothetical protein
MLKMVEILVLVWILKIASARMGARENLRTFPFESYSSPSRAGIELVTIT